MKIVTNTKLITRNAKIGLWGQLFGMGLLLASVILSFQSPSTFGLSVILFTTGLLISQVGIYFGNRWSRRPRPDEILDKALKGLDRNYTFYHYRSPVSHLLIGPAGVWALLPRSTRGTIVYQAERGRWKQRGGGILFKLFGQEGLGRPDLDSAADIARLERFLAKKLPPESIPPIRAALVFTHEDVELEVNGAPFPALHPRKLKSLMRNQAKHTHLSQDRIRALVALLPQE